MRDNFSKTTKEILAKRVGYKCSNPNCRINTVGPHSIENKIINIGVAAHIAAASMGGPRYDVEMNIEEKKSIRNGIWLCQSCSKLIDTDANLFTINELIRWKNLAEKESLAFITSKHPQEDQTTYLQNQRIKVHEKLFYELREADTLLGELIGDNEMTISEKKDTAFYLGLQVAKFTDDNSFHLQEEVIVQCVGTFVGISDFFEPSTNLNKYAFALYKKNLRAAYKLLKSIDSKGNIEITKRTPLMDYFSKLKSEQENDDFL